jgi:hypothetical protein
VSPLPRSYPLQHANCARLAADDALQFFHLARFHEVVQHPAAYQYAEIFAQWGDRKAALDWLEKAMRLRDPGLVYTKVDPLMEPLRNEPRFQTVMQELQFPK